MHGQKIALHQAGCQRITRAACGLVSWVNSSVEEGELEMGIEGIKIRREVLKSI